MFTKKIFVTGRTERERERKRERERERERENEISEEVSEEVEPKETKRNNPTGQDRNTEL